MKGCNMTEKIKRVKIKHVGELLEAAAGRFVSEAEAAYFAELYIESHLRKYPRMNPIEEALDDLKVWEKATNHSIITDLDKEGVLLLDFNGLAPTLKIKYVHDELEKRAKKCGIAAAGYRNSSGVVTLNLWSNGLARRDMIGISLFNGGVGCCVPHNGTRGFFGTAPMAYAIPTLGQPILLDMATTEIPFFEIANAKKQGTPLKKGAAVDRQGRPTTDAGKALGDDGVCNLLPIGGGFKGYGIVMLIEVLTGSLVRSLTSAQQTPGWDPPEYGGLIMAIDIGSFTDIGHFKSEVSDMCDVIRSQPSVEGQDGVTIPGDRGHGRVKTALSAGKIEIKDEIFEALKNLSSRS